MLCMALEKAAVLIDNYYLRKEVLDVYNGKTGRFKLDYQRLSDSLCKSIDTTRLRTYIYDCQVKKRSKFFQVIESAGQF